MVVAELLTFPWMLLQLCICVTMVANTYSICATMDAARNICATWQHWCHYGPNSTVSIWFQILFPTFLKSRFTTLQFKSWCWWWTKRIYTDTLWTLYWTFQNWMGTAQPNSNCYEKTVGYGCLWSASQSVRLPGFPLITSPCLWILDMIMDMDMDAFEVIANQPDYQGSPNIISPCSLILLLLAAWCALLTTSPFCEPQTNTKVMMWMVMKIF